jgi:hypothetical protein
VDDHGGVLQVLATRLRDARRCGARFERAWPAARRYALNACPMRPRERDAWLGLLAATRAAWGRAYAGDPATTADVAAVRLRDAILDEAEVADHRRHDVLVA